MTSDPPTCPALPLPCTSSGCPAPSPRNDSSRDKDVLFYVRIQSLLTCGLESQSRPRTRLPPMALVCVLKHTGVVTYFGWRAGSLGLNSWKWNETWQREILLPLLNHKTGIFGPSEQEPAHSSSFLHGRRFWRTLAWKVIIGKML